MEKPMKTMLEYDVWIARVSEDNPDFAEAYDELSRFEVTDSEVKNDEEEDLIEDKPL
jgi:hypothetical protein